MTGFLYSAAAWLTKPLPRNLGRCLRRATYPHDFLVNPAISSSETKEHCANIEQFADPVRAQILTVSMPCASHAKGGR